MKLQNFIPTLSDTDDFWNEELNLTKQTCFMNFSKVNDQNVAKNWFNDEKTKAIFLETTLKSYLKNGTSLILPK